MKLQRDDIFTGLFVLIGTILGIGTLLTLLGYNIFENRTSYLVRMEKLAGLQKGTSIFLKDYIVGQVDEVIPIYGSSIFFKAKVSIDSDLILYRGTKVNITKQNIIGDTALEIFPSSDRSHRLKVNDTLFAANIVNLDQMVNKISSLVNNVTDLIGQFGDIAGGNKGTIKMLFMNLNSSIVKVNRILASSENSINATMQNLAKTSATLEKFSKEISKNPLLLLGGKRSKRNSSNNNSSSSALP